MERRFSSYLPIVGVFCCALIARVVYNMTVAKGYIPEYDADFYNTIAIHLNTEHCYCLQSNVPDFDRAPLWPFVIAAIYAVMGFHNLYARLFLCLLGSCTCVLTYLLARDVFNKKVALVVGIIAAVYPGLFIYDGWLYSESVYTFFVISFAYSLFRLQRTPRIGWMIGCGVSLAGASLTRPNGIALLVLVLIWAAFMLRTRILPWGKVVQTVLVITCLTFGLIAPWTLRNYTESHQFILIATGSGQQLAGLYNDAALTSHYFGALGLWLPASQVRPPLTDRSDAGETAYAFRWIRTHLADMPYLLSLHFINMWRPYTSEEGLPVREFPSRLSSKVVWFLMNTTPVAIIFLAACGLVVTFRSKRKELLGTYLVIGLTIVVCIVLMGSSRFRAPIEPLLVLLTGGAIWWLTANEPGTLRLLHRKERSANLTKAEPAAVNI
jgi:4-amino-4-deoxy-L-arabinose transferase-like glycosyltransferase